MNRVYKLIVGIITIFLLWSVYNYVKNDTVEHFPTATNTLSPQISNECLQNVGSVYNKKKLQITNLDVTGNLTNNGNNVVLPKGVVIAWAGNWTGTTGDISKVPDGWALCDGKAHPVSKDSKTTMVTPDLTHRFIYGVGPGSTIGSKGGESTVTLTEAHMPSHSHSTPRYSKCTGKPCSMYYNQSGGWGDYRTKFSTAKTGGNGAHNNIPPYTVLAYIIKLW